MNDISLPPDAKSLAKLFKQVGYNTANIGKRQLNGTGRSAFIPKEKEEASKESAIKICQIAVNK